MENHRQLDLTLALGCTVGCNYCPQSATIRAAKKQGILSNVMSLEVLECCLDKLPQGLLLNFAGYTEPFQNPACADMIEMSVKRGFRVAVYTTLKGCSEANLSKIEPLNIETFEVHLPTASGREAILVDDTYLACLERVHGLTSARFLLMAWGTEPRIRDDVAPFVDNDRVVVSGTNSRAGNMASNLIKGMRQPRKILKCDRSLLSNNLLPNGDVTVCCQDFGLSHIIGNLRTDSYASLFQSEEFLRVKAGLDDPDANVLCRTCEYANVAS